MSILLADVPDIISVTPDELITETLVIAGLSFPAGETTNVNFVISKDQETGPGDKSDIYQALRTAQQKGLIVCDPVVDVLSDPVASGHTLSGGQDATGTIGVE